MNVRFWGTRGSVPASYTAPNIRSKIKKALELAAEKNFAPAAAGSDALDAFIDTLPFSVRGTYGSNTSCVQVDAESDEYVLCDAGTGLRDFGNAMLGKHGPGTPQTYHVFLSHLHWDHIQGFPFFVPAYIPGNRIVLHGGHREMETAFRVQHGSPFFPINFDELGASVEFAPMVPGDSVTVGGMIVRMLRLSHPGDSFGYRFEHDGASVVYATDNEHTHEPSDPDHPYHQFIKNADLLIFDAQYSYAEAATSKRDWGHSSNMAAVEVAKAHGVRKLALFHQDPGQPDEALDSFLEQTAKLGDLLQGEALEIFMAHDGLEMKI